MCLFRLSELNCVSTNIRRNPEFRQLLMGMSISRYLPAMGTAGLERWTVSGNRREPRPPPRITLRTSFMRCSPAAPPILARGRRRVSPLPARRASTLVRCPGDRRHRPPPRGRPPAGRRRTPERPPATRGGGLARGGRVAVPPAPAPAVAARAPARDPDHGLPRRPPHPGGLRDARDRDGARTGSREDRPRPP